MFSNSLNIDTDLNIKEFMESWLIFQAKWLQKERP